MVFMKLRSFGLRSPQAAMPKQPARAAKAPDVDASPLAAGGTAWCHNL
jgi:hypothetical protein